MGCPPLGWNPGGWQAAVEGPCEPLGRAGDLGETVTQAHGRQQAMAFAELSIGRQGADAPATRRLPRGTCPQGQVLETEVRS
ncbi:hypothetical protein ASNO1_13480 [Corallococcus caeni]|uniref:Uncharacterized protein n=1 Tax=Corallococcus caeni TaxID=3082388 RepID=A0ABQ6QM48_9BACT|nr:hypothetical protein ASNO1_13480 [Corallococcus sp. NO1]